MQVFHCDNCGALVFFENVSCLTCGHRLAFLPDVGTMSTLEQRGDLWYATSQPELAWRLCRNYLEHDVCNWAVPASDPEPLCTSCRLTTVIPDAADPTQRLRWYKLESSKRRLVKSLMTLSLPVVSKSVDAERGLAFEFKAQPVEPAAEPVLTGHANGVITINLDEADDAEREKRRVALHEPYRTVLGHLRHESGHYYWDLLIAGGDRLARCRELFGDEQQDYAAALERHYNEGPPPDWQQNFVSAYCSSHPWEDWAETWAHYLHITDTLETAASCGVTLRPTRRDEPAMARDTAASNDFDRMIDGWLSVTYMLNSLNRGLGLADAYPFVLSSPAIGKLRFVHDTIHSSHLHCPEVQSGPRK
jgi:hypothetical protein